jgi:DNA polymerase-3 subunit chi
MARVDFHILSHAGNEPRARHACQLIEQLYQQKKPVFVRVENELAAKTMDDLLWSFRDQAFIPHELCTAGSPPSDPLINVLIGIDKPLGTFQSTLINLSDSMPAQMEGVSHLIEVIDAEPVHKQAARERYKLYRDAGHQLETINN